MYRRKWYGLLYGLDSNNLIGLVSSFGIPRSLIHFRGFILVFPHLRSYSKWPLVTDGVYENFSWKKRLYFTSDFTHFGIIRSNLLWVSITTDRRQNIIWINNDKYCWNIYIYIYICVCICIYCYCTEETWQCVSVHWQHGKCQIWADCFMWWRVI